MPTSKPKPSARKWKPKQRANFIAAMKARREAIAKGLDPPIPKYKQVKAKDGITITTEQKLPVSKEAIIYLQHAERTINNNLRSGRQKALSQDQLFTLLALACLRGRG